MERVEVVVKSGGEFGTVIAKNPISYSYILSHKNSVHGGGLVLLQLARNGGVLREKRLVKNAPIY